MGASCCGQLAPDRHFIADLNENFLHSIGAVEAASRVTMLVKICT
jgi:hypothetical protein